MEQPLAVQPQLTLLDNFHMTYDDWQGGKVGPIRVGRFLIAPPWDKIWNQEADEEIIPLIIDPGVVFGNGSHP
ncbi:MAG: 50S ribosomal protein L11 methyltransferase, partial [Deltaproteobacteria bacterium]